MGSSSASKTAGTQQGLLQSLDAGDFVDHPNFHIIAPFFAGLVFWSSLGYIACSPFFRYILRLGWQRLGAEQFFGGRVRGVSQVSGDTEAQLLGRTVSSESEKGQAIRNARLSITESIYRRGENPTLIFALTLLFLMSSFSQFLSTLTLTTEGSSSASSLCAFLVAWDAMSSQFARLLGLFIMGLIFRTLLTKHWEIWVYWGVLGATTVLVFVTNALSTGVVKSTSDLGLKGFTANLCYRRHFLPTSITVSLLSLTLETYSILRLLFIIAPPSFPLRRRLDALTDVRILRIASLILYDMIIMVPNAINTTYAGDTVPYSISALIVLYAFNSLHNTSEFFLQELPRVEVKPPLPGRNPSLRRARPASIEIGDLYMGRHPFSASALENNSSQQDIWRIARISNLTTASVASTHIARSVRDAVVQTATREKFTPSPSEPDNPAPRRRSRSKSKSRSSGQTQSSSSKSTRKGSLKRSFSGLLSRPIISKSELAKVGDIFGGSTSQSLKKPPVATPNVLGPPPPRPRVPPPQPPPPLPIDTKKKSRGISIIDSVPGTARSLYGSDIIRPKSGQRNKMKHAPTVSNGSSGGSVASQGTIGTTVTIDKSNSSSNETVRASAISARTVDTQRTAGTSGTVAFGGDEWPLPPDEPVPPLPAHFAEQSRVFNGKARSPAGSPPSKVVGLPPNPRSSPVRKAGNLLGPRAQVSPKQSDYPSQPRVAKYSSVASVLGTKAVSPPRPTRVVRGPRPPPTSPGIVSRFSGWTESDAGGLEDGDR